MKFAVLALLGVIFQVGSVNAADSLPIPRLHGLYTYQGNFAILDIRRQELVPSQTPGGKARIKELRQEGYTCINKNLQTQRCWKHWVPSTPPAGIENSLASFMKGVEVQFEKTDIEAKLVYDAGSKQDWQIWEPVRLSQKVVGLYQVTRMREGGIYLSFPVSEDQPLGNLTFFNESRLGLRLVANSRESESVVVTFTLMPYLDRGL